MLPEGLDLVASIARYEPGHERSLARRSDVAERLRWRSSRSEESNVADASRRTRAARSSVELGREHGSISVQRAAERAELSSRATVPPSEPRSSRASFDALDAQVDRPARLQMIVALILGLVLVAIPLYLWRRPRAESISVDTGVRRRRRAARRRRRRRRHARRQARHRRREDPLVPRPGPEEDGARAVRPRRRAREGASRRRSRRARRASRGRPAAGRSSTSPTSCFKKKTVTVDRRRKAARSRTRRSPAACERAVKSKLSTLALRVASSTSTRRTACRSRRRTRGRSSHRSVESATARRGTCRSSVYASWRALTCWRRRSRPRLGSRQRHRRLHSAPWRRRTDRLRSRLMTAAAHRARPP